MKESLNRLKIDETDRSLIKMLFNDGRLTHEAMAGELGLSRPAVHKRVQNLTENGVIKGYKADIGWEAIGLGVDALIMLSVNTKDFNRMLKDVLALSNEDYLILSVYRVTGNHCVMARVRTRSTSDLTILHDKLLSLTGIRETYTVLILQEMELVF